MSIHDPRSRKTVKVTVLLPVEVVRNMEKVVESRGYVNISEFIREAIRDHLDKKGSSIWKTSLEN